MLQHLYVWWHFSVTGIIHLPLLIDDIISRLNAKRCSVDIFSAL